MFRDSGAFGDIGLYAEPAETFPGMNSQMAPYWPSPAYVSAAHRQ
jgi:hypothetical protein